jgi:hypothetical protein
MSATLMLAASMLAANLPFEAAVGTGVEPPPQVLVVMTYAQLGWTGRASFIQSSMRIAGMLPSVPGVLGNDQGIRWFGAEVWTITAWRTEAELQAFVHGAEHGKAMREGAVAIRDIRLHRLHCRADAVPAGWGSVKKVLAGELPEGCESVETKLSAPAGRAAAGRTRP